MAVVPDLVQAEIFIEDVEVEAVSLTADSSIVVGIVTLRRSAETVVPVETVAIMIGDWNINVLETMRTNRRYSIMPFGSSRCRNRGCNNRRCGSSYGRCSITFRVNRRCRNRQSGNSRGSSRLRIRSCCRRCRDCNRCNCERCWVVFSCCCCCDKLCRSFNVWSKNKLVTPVLLLTLKQNPLPPSHHAVNALKYAPLSNYWHVQYRGCFEKFQPILAFRTPASA